MLFTKWCPGNRGVRNLDDRGSTVVTFNRVLKITAGGAGLANCCGKGTSIAVKGSPPTHTQKRG